MCLNPIRVKNNSTYKVSSIMPFFHEVPCGKCHECRQYVKNDWLTRISFELDSLYKRGGFGVFLTFSYNDLCLPIYKDKDSDFEFPCFNHSDVTTFLNRLKVSINRLFGPSSYKYFFTSEYGKNTRRPHYHGMFFLERHVDLFQFVETCRKCWTYGFMFPKFDKRKGCYVDNFGNGVTPELLSKTGSAFYVSKYITKDLSYFESPEISNYLLDRRNYFKMRKYFPKHWQSNKLGITAIDACNLYDFASTLKHGIFNPVLCCQVPVPRFILNKLKYKNVSTKGKSYERKSYDGKSYLYDRELTTFGRDILAYEFDNKVYNQNHRFMHFFQSHDCDVDLKSCGIDIYNVDSFTNLSLYYILVRKFSPDIVKRELTFFGNNLTDFSYKACRDLYITLHDVAYLRSISDGFILKDNHIRCDDFSAFDSVLSIWQFISRIESDNNFKERIRRECEQKDASFNFKYKFDKKYC